MSKSEASISKVSASAFHVPVQGGYESDGTLAWKKTTVVLAEIHAGGHSGLGYSYAHESAASLIRDALSAELHGKDALDIPALHTAMLTRVRNIGRQGIASHAIAATDIALWDLKGKLLGLPLSKLLGQARPAIAAYGSGGFTSYSIGELQKQLGAWVDEGMTRVKMKIGDEPDGQYECLERVRAARMAIGLEAELFVDANSAYSPREALALAERLEEHQVSWFEEPVSSDDLRGLAFVRDHLKHPMDIAAGEYGYDAQYFERMIGAKAVDVIQIDATRCLGVTGFLKAASICGARHIPVSAHTAPQIHAHLCCALPEARHVEYFYDHVRIESMLFDGALKPENGYLVPDLGRPGLGIELKRADAEKLAA